MGNIFWIIIFVIAGVTQTPELKSVAFIVLLIAFIFPIIIQVVWLIVNLRMSSNK